VPRWRGDRSGARRAHTIVRCSGKVAAGTLWTFVVDDRASSRAPPPLVWCRFTAKCAGVHVTVSSPSSPGFSGFTPIPRSSCIYAANCVSEVACWPLFRRELSERHKQQPTVLTIDLLDGIG